MEQAILLFFEQLRTPALTVFFGIFSFLGEGIVVGGVVLLLYWLIGGDFGEQLLVTALSSAGFNAMMKTGVARPRPYAAGKVSRLDVDVPFFSTTDLGDYLSFPSGHAQASASALFAGSLRKKRAWMWAVSVLFLLLVCCSRLYFGVHYPSDVLMGTAFGLLVAGFWNLIYRELHAYRYIALAIFALAVLLPLPLAPEGDYPTMAGLLSGGAVFLPLASFLRYDGAPKKFRVRLLRLPVGLLSVGAVYAATSFFPEGAAYSLLTWFLLAGAGIFLARVFFKIFKI